MEEMNGVGLGEAVERLSAAAGALETAVQMLVEKQATITASAEESIGRIVATVESAREAELERKLEEAEHVIAELRAAAASSTAAGRKTAVAATVMAKGLGGGVNELAAVDAALTSLSVEQRIAVKAEMLRAGLLR